MEISVYTDSVFPSFHAHCRFNAAGREIPSTFICLVDGCTWYTGTRHNLVNLVHLDGHLARWRICALPDRIMNLDIEFPRVRRALLAIKRARDDRTYTTKSVSAGEKKNKKGARKENAHLPRHKSGP